MQPLLRPLALQLWLTTTRPKNLLCSARKTPPFGWVGDVWGGDQGRQRASVHLTSHRPGGPRPPPCPAQRPASFPPPIRSGCPNQHRWAILTGMRSSSRARRGMCSGCPATHTARRVGAAASGSQGQAGQCMCKGIGRAPAASLIPGGFLPFLPCPCPDPPPGLPASLQLTRR